MEQARKSATTNIYDLTNQIPEVLSGGEWPKFLQSAAWNFRFSFLSQGQIYLQRPDATACYTFNDWNKRFARKIKKGAKGIALLDDSQPQLVIRHVFDYSDTYSPDKKELKTWELTSEKETQVRKTLADAYGMPDTGEEGTFQDFTAGIVQKLLEDELETSLPQLMREYHRGRSKLSELSEEDARSLYQRLLENSVTAMLLYRCGQESVPVLFPKERFAGMEYFNTAGTISVLGNSVQHISAGILKSVARAVNAYDRQHKEELTHETEHSISQGRGVLRSEPENSGRTGRGAAGQVRENAPELSQGEPARTIHRPAHDRPADETSVRDRQDHPQAGGENTPAAPEESAAAQQGSQSSGLDAAHGDAAQTGGGTGLSRNDLPVTTVTRQDIDNALRRDIGKEGCKFHVQQAVESGEQDLLEVIKEEYEQASTGFYFEDGTRGILFFEEDGLNLIKNRKDTLFLTWDEIKDRMTALVQEGTFLDDAEKERYPGYAEEESSRKERQALGEEIIQFAKSHAMPSRNEFLRRVKAYVTENSDTSRQSLTGTLESFYKTASLSKAEETHVLSFLSRLQGTPSLGENEPGSATDAGIEVDFPTQEEQEKAIEENEKPLAAADQSEQEEAFLSDHIADILHSSDSEKAPWSNVVAYFRDHTDEQDRTGFLAARLGDAYTMFSAKDGTQVGFKLHTDEGSFEVWQEGYLSSPLRFSRPLSELLRFAEIENDRHLAVHPELTEEPSASLPATGEGTGEPTSGERISEEEPVQPAEDVESQLPTAASEPVQVEQKEPQAGDRVTLEGTEYLILGINESQVTLQDVSRPVFSSDFPRYLFDALLAESFQQEQELREDPTAAPQNVPAPQQPVEEHEAPPAMAEPSDPAENIVAEEQEARTLLQEMVSQYQDWFSSEEGKLQGEYFLTVRNEVRRLQDAKDIGAVKENILYAGYLLKTYLPHPDENTERGAVTENLLARADKVLGGHLNYDVARLRIFKNGGEDALFNDLQHLILTHFGEHLSKDILPILRSEAENDLYESIPRAYTYLADRWPLSDREGLEQRSYDALVKEAERYCEDRSTLHPDHAEPRIDHPELLRHAGKPKTEQDKAAISLLLAHFAGFRGAYEEGIYDLSETDKMEFQNRVDDILELSASEDVNGNEDTLKTLLSFFDTWLVPNSGYLSEDGKEEQIRLLDFAKHVDFEKLRTEQEDSISFEPGDRYTDAYTGPDGGIIDEVYPPDASQRREGAFTYHTTSHPTGYAMSMPIAIERIQNGEATLTKAAELLKGKAEQREEPSSSGFAFEAARAIEQLLYTVEPARHLEDHGTREDALQDIQTILKENPSVLQRTLQNLRDHEENEEVAAQAEELLSRLQQLPHSELEPTLFDFETGDGKGKGSEPGTKTRSRGRRSNPDPAPVKAAPQIPDSEGRINYHAPETAENLGGPKSRFQHNVEAIRLLKNLEEEGRLATGEEQEVLAKYVGWGGLADAFDVSKDSWKAEYEELKELLTQEEYEAARASTLTAFYTPPEVIDTVYRVLENLGFEKGNILDPGCGIGHFSGRLPEQMRESKVYGIEKDSISGRIAQQLYQKNNIAIEGYERTKLPDNFFDVAVGNVPFGNFKVNDRRYDKMNLQIHDYFFAKTLDKVRPGGVVAFVTSMGTMDKEGTDFRRYLAQRADLLGAIRLPNSTFRQNAGTQVTSDILFLQKRETPNLEEPEWVDLDRPYNDVTGNWDAAINGYFASNPEMILGDMKTVSGPHGPEQACIAREGQDLRQALQEAADQIHGAITQPATVLYDQEEEKRDSIPAISSVRNYSFALVDDTVYFREDSEMVHVPFKNAVAEQRVRGMIELRDCLYELIDAQMEDRAEEEIVSLQKQLNTLYDAYTKKYGILNSSTNARVFSDDSAYYLLCSLEHVDDKKKFLGKADIFFKRTIYPQTQITHVNSAEEALTVSMGQRGRIDFEYMERLSGISGTELKKELEGKIFEDPENPGEYIIGALYLSGNVRKKLRAAQVAANREPERYAANVQHLTEVIPQDLGPGEITVKLGATWIDPEYVQQFMYELFQTPSNFRADIFPDRAYGLIKVQYSPVINAWNIDNITWNSMNIRAKTTYGTARLNGYELLQMALNLKDPKVYDTVADANGDPHRVLNETETLAAQEKQQMIKDAFVEWLWKDPERAETLCREYNNRFNAYVPPSFDGSLVTLHDANSSIELRPWQKEGIARILFNGNTQLAHSVGAGKTWTMVAAAMESKYLGLSNKSLIVVPNHLVGQWTSAIYDLYPNAKVLASTKKDFQAGNRKKFCSRIGTGDYDIVVIGHSQFEKIPLSEERQKANLQKEIDDIVSAIQKAKYSAGEGFSVKQMERTKNSLEARLAKLSNADKKDSVITFEQLGIDRLFVDESHLYKNLFLYTKMSNVAGISQTDSQRASDMFMKCRYMDELTGGKGIVFATGTPLSNTMAEMYTSQRYLQYELLQEMGLGSLDQWASTFGETATSIELAPEGTGFRARTRFAKFYNLPELISLYRQFADIRTPDMLDLPVPTPHQETVVIPPSDIQKQVVLDFGERAKRIRGGGVRPTEDNMLKITTEGRKLALDERLIDPSYPDEPHSKINYCAEKIFKIWKDTSAQKSTQLVFCDISTPNKNAFNVYDDLKTKLVKRGIPAEEVRFIHEAETDAQKEALFQKVRDGDVRILMGSTGKMGTGTNVQDLLVAGHNLDCPYRPSDLEQRNGRIIRQNNSNDDVYIFNYVTEGTFDAYMYQLLENKQRFISQIFTSKTPVRQAEDLDEITLSFAEIKALSSGDPRIKERVELEADVQRLNILKSRHDREMYLLNQQANFTLPKKIKECKHDIDILKYDLPLLEKFPARTESGGFVPITVKGVVYKKAGEGGEEVRKALESAPQWRSTVIGQLRGFSIVADKTDPTFMDPGIPCTKLYVKGNAYSTQCSVSDNPVALCRVLNHVIDSIPENLKNLERDLDQYTKQLVQTKEELDKPFLREEELKEKSRRLEELTKELDVDAQDKGPQPVQQAGEKGEPKPSLAALVGNAESRQANQASQNTDMHFTRFGKQQR